MPNHRFTDLSLERIAIDHGIELTVVRGDYYLVVRFEIADLPEGKLALSNSDLLPLLHSLLHIGCELAIRDDGTLHIAFENGRLIKVQPDARFEAWELVSNSGERWICMPGGELAIWSSPNGEDSRPC